LPIFSNSFFNIEDVEDKSNAPTGATGVNVNKHTFKDLRAFSILSCRSCYATHLCQRPFYKIFAKFRNSKTNVLKIVLIIVNINKDENKSLISNQFSLKNDL
jgi:hypothetical protein